MAKRTVELEDSTGPFGVKLKADNEGAVSLVIYDNRVNARGRIQVEAEGLNEVNNLGAILQDMVESLEARK